MVGLYKDPQGKKVFAMSQAGGHHSEEEEDTAAEDLKQRIKQLEAELERKVIS